MQHAPIDRSITIRDLEHAPYPIYRRLRADAPVVKVPAINRILLTKAEDTRAVKEDPVLFSSNDPHTPMERAFQAHTLMRKDGAEHRRERMAMARSLSPRTIMSDWEPLYRKIVAEYLDRLPEGGVVDLFTDVCAPVAARILAHMLGIEEATDAEMMHWSQVLIDGAGNFGQRPEPFAASDLANAEMNALFDTLWARHVAEPNPSAFSEMVNSKAPIEKSQIYANIKIAIGGGINEPRDALSTTIFGLLTCPEQLEEVRRTQAWDAAFDEAVRWVAPIQVSSRLVTEDTEIRGYCIPKGEVVMTVQASANRDEELYVNGEVFDVFRAQTGHQSYGTGPHHCLGSHAARRTVGAIMLPMLFERFPNMQLPDPDSVRWFGFGFRGPLNLPVRLG